MSLCPPQILHGLTWDSTKASVVKSQWLSSWAIAGLCFYLPSAQTEKYQCNTSIVSCLLPHVGKAMHTSCPQCTSCSWVENYILKQLTKTINNMNHNMWCYSLWIHLWDARIHSQKALFSPTYVSGPWSCRAFYFADKNFVLRTTGIWKWTSWWH